jgi:hypothetical protein
MRGITLVIFFILLLAPLSGCVDDAPAPEVSTITVQPSLAKVGDSLTCDYSVSDPGEVGVHATVEWLVNGDNAGTGATFSAPVGGSSVACKISITANDFSASSTSPAITIGNSQPIISLVTISPTSDVGTGDRVSCFASVSDVDGNDVTITYRWLNGETVIANSSELDIDSIIFSPGDTMTCTASVDDGSGGIASASDSKVLVNTVPAINSVSLTPNSPVSGDELTCSWLFYDVDGDLDSSSIIWKVNGVAITSTALTYTAISSGDEIICEVTPNDGELSGVAASSAMVVVLNSQPSISTVTITPNTGIISSSVLSCSATGQDIDGTVEISYVWSNGATIVGGGPTLSMDSQFYSPGDIITCTATAEDSDDASISASAYIAIGNSAPVVSGVSLYPASANIGDTLNCNYTFTDSNEDNDSSHITWTIDGVASGNSSTLIAPTGGSQVSCTVTANDGQDDGNAMVSTVMTITNTIPVITGIYITPASAVVGESLLCFYTLNDADSDPDNTTLRWFVDGIVAENGTSMTAPVTGSQVICQATPDDGIAVGVAVNSSALIIGNTPPVISAVTLTPQSAVVGDTLTCNYSYSDADEQGDQSIVNWQVDGQHYWTSSSISAPVGGSDVSCSVTAFDGESTGNTQSTANITIANSAPMIASVSLSPNPAYYGDIITCTPAATDADGEQLTYDYQWYVNTILDSGVTSAVHDAPVGGDMIECRVSANDGHVSSTQVSSGYMMISNTNPTIDTISINPSATIHTDTAVTCLATASDIDGHQFTLLYEWFVRGLSVGSGSSLTLNSTISAPGDDLVCVVSAEDDLGGMGTDSVTEIIANYDPILSSVTIDPNTGVTTTTTLTCSAIASDADDESIGFSYEWINLDTGSILGISATLTLQTSTASSGDMIQCTVVASDNSGGVDVDSTMVTVD